MISRKLSFIIVISFITLFLNSCKTEEIILHGELNGLITDGTTGQPVQKAVITLNPLSDTTFSGSDGKYIFRNIAPGNYDLEVLKEYYFQVKKNVTIYSDSIKSVDFNLEKTPNCKISVSYLDFGSDSTIKKFTLANTGNGRLYYLVVADTDWIAVSSSSNSGFLMGPLDTITVKINKTGLSSDKHSGKIIVWSNSGQNWLSDTVYVFLNGVVDQDLNVYNVVTIGSSTWMAENLNVGNYVENSMAKSSTIFQKHCYGNNEVNCRIYGGLYDWQTMMQSTYPDNSPVGTTRGICPVGWHIPTQAEWQTLIDYLGGTWKAGGKMKETGISHWAQPNIATGESGFKALPGGADFYNNFSGLENSAYFWSASKNNYGDNYSRTSYFINNSDVAIMPEEKDYLYYFSVRCVKDPDK
jgi:uncharacterized protein (TIGR02145 family)